MLLVIIERWIRMKKKIVAILLVLVIVLGVAMAFSDEIQPRAAICTSCYIGQLFPGKKTSIEQRTQQCPHCILLFTCYKYTTLSGLECNNCGAFWAESATISYQQAVCPTHGPIPLPSDFVQTR